MIAYQCDKLCLFLSHNLFLRAKTGTSTWSYAVSSTAAGRMYQGMEYNGFLFDASSKIKLHSSALLEKPDHAKEFVRLPLLGYFKVES